MVDGLALLADSHVWLVACLVAAVLCGYRARRRGYSEALFASLGLMLGPGAVPVTWLATREELNGEKGLGFIPDEEGALPGDVGSALERQVEVALSFGLGWGLLANVSQALTLFIPVIFQQTAAEYERKVWQIRTVWSALMLVGPALTYLLYTRLLTVPHATARRIFCLPPWMIPLMLLIFFGAVVLLLAGGFQVYMWHCNR